MAAAIRRNEGIEPGEDRSQVGALWLVRLRWGAASLLATGLAGAGLWLDRSAALLLPSLLLALMIATNLWVSRAVRGSPSPRRICGAMLAFDTLLLTGLLAATGGPWNPFSIFYLVYITLSAVLLGSRWTWGLTLLSIACFGSLFALAAEAHHDATVTALHLHGMWLAFTLAAVLTAYFVTALSGAVARRDRELAAVRERAARSERLAAVTTLAAGAAHELATPLSTIAVAAHEMARRLEARPGGPPIAHAPAGRRLDDTRLFEDVALIRTEVDRCREILDRMSADFGELSAEALLPVSPGDLVREVARRFSEAAWARVRVECPSEREPLIVVPPRALGIAVGNLVRNALDATGPQQPVTLQVGSSEGRVRFRIRDRGPGMTPEVLARAVEPFFTTKEPGEGMGLGLFLSHTLAERLGGHLTLRSEPGSGVDAELELPLPLVARAPLGARA